MKVAKRANLGLRPTSAAIELGRHLLLVDREALGEDLKRRLETWGKVTWAHNLDDAAAAFSNRAFSALIVDVGLERPWGFAVLEAFRKLHPKTPALVLTGSLAEADSVRACELGAQYVGKPISRAALTTFMDSTTSGRLGNLSQREQAVLDRLCKGDSVKVIALDTGTADSTVRSILRRAKQKTGARSRSELLDLKRALIQQRVLSD
jgi:DNA-binding NarL/FixJ family response regulator